MKECFIYTERDEDGFLNTVVLFELKGQLSEQRVVVRQLDYEIEPVIVNDEDYVKLAPIKGKYLSNRYLVCSYMNKKQTIIQFHPYEMVKIDIAKNPFPIILKTCLPGFKS